MAKDMRRIEAAVKKLEEKVKQMERISSAHARILSCVVLALPDEGFEKLRQAYSKLFEQGLQPIPDEEEIAVQNLADDFLNSAANHRRNQ